MITKHSKEMLGSNKNFFFILGLSSVVDYSCTLTPLFSIELLSNQSYILQLNFSPHRAENGSDTSNLDTFGITESPVVIKQAFLTLIVEDRGFHTAMFYLKCFCVPFILGGEFSYLQ